MEVSVTKKPNRYAALITYLFAIVCLLLGLFLPLFNGQGILALQLPQALNSLAGKEILKFGKDFTFGRSVYLFGAVNKPFDIMALLMLVYAAVTALGLLALIPIGISVKKNGKSYCTLMRIIETASALTLSVSLLIALQYAPENTAYNLIIALCGSVIALIALIADGANGFSKTVLFLLSAISLLAMFNFTLMFPKLKTPLSDFADKLHMHTDFVGSAESSAGISAIQCLILLFEGRVSLVHEDLSVEVITFFEHFKGLPSAKDKAVIALITITALIAAVNYFIDVISLSTNGKRTGLTFNLIRYGLGVLALIALVIAVPVCKYKIGLLLVLMMLAVLLQFVISSVRFGLAVKKAAVRRAEEAEETITFAKPPKRIKERNEEPVMEPAPVRRRNDERARAVNRPVRPPVMDMEVIETPAQNEVIEEIKAPAPQPAENTVEAEVMQKPEEISEAVVNEDEFKHETVAEVQIEEVQPVEIHEEQPVGDDTFAEPVKPVEPFREEVIRTAEPVRNEEVKRVEPVREEVVKTAEVHETQAKPAEVREVKRVEPAPEKVVKPVTAQPIYIVGESSDDFLKKLSNEEKLEFTRTFIEKTNGNLGSVPEYVIGGNNRKFFSSVFIYLGRLRGMISDNLLNKMYQELNML